MKSLRKVFTGEQKEEDEKDFVSQVRRGPCVCVCRLIHHRQ